MARPRIEIDREQFEKLCSLQCTLTEIASFFNCSEDTIENWCKREYKKGFSDVFRIKRSVGKISLRRTQFQMAEHNVTMAIWLGKQYLGQSDKQEVEVAINEDETVREMERYFDGRKQRRNSEPTMGESD